MAGTLTDHRWDLGGAPKAQPGWTVCDGGLATNASINGPHAIAIDGRTAYVIESFGNLIRSVDLNTGLFRQSSPK